MRGRVVLGCISSLLWTGCPAQELAPVEPCTVSSVDDSTHVSPVDQVDLLFVIDDSGSMRAEQEKLRAQLPVLVEALATGHVDDDGVQDFPPVRDLHLGIVSSNMGTLNATRGACTASKDGLLQSGLERCEGAEGSTPYLAFAPDPSAPDLAARAAELGQRFGCLAQLGTDGCGHEQQLEAALKALVPATSTLRFSQQTLGHGDGANTGFLRRNSVVAVIVVSDEDDCSHPDSSAFLTENDPQVNIKCGMNPDAAHPTERFVEGLRALRPDNPENVIFGAIVGVPLAASGRPADEILALPEMHFSTMPSAMGFNAQVPADVCTSVDGEAGGASAALRIVDVARQFGDQSSVHSICADDYRPAMDAILRKIGEQLRGSCLVRPLRRTGGEVPCEVTETLRPGEACDPAHGRTPLGVVEGRELCLVQQLPVTGDQVGPGVGWYYDDFSDRAAAECPESSLQLAFSSGAAPTGESIRFECLQSLRTPSLSSRGRAATGVPCPQEGCETLNDETSTLFCAADGTCQLRCDSDQDCSAGSVCHAPQDPEGQLQEPRCVNPRCAG